MVAVTTGGVSQLALDVVSERTRGEMPGASYVTWLAVITRERAKTKGDRSRDVPRMVETREGRAVCHA